MKIMIVSGPTATGKSKLAVMLAKKFSGEIINADSRQFFRGMDIGTAKPEIKSRQGIPHHLFDWLEPTTTASAGLFLRAADKLIQDITGRGKVPFVVGGTALYLKTLAYGLADVPAIDPAIKERLHLRASQEGLVVLYEELCRLDPAFAAMIHPKHKSRILRALAVFTATGQSLRAFQASHPLASVPRYEILWLGLNCERSELKRTIESRVKTMFANGLVAETKKMTQEASDSSVLQTAIGYREVVEMLAGVRDEASAIHQTVLRTRQLAKRQITFLKGIKPVEWFDSKDWAGMTKRVEQFLEITRNTT